MTRIVAVSEWRLSQLQHAGLQVYQLRSSSSAVRTANMNRSICHCALSRPEQAGAFLITLSTANQRLKLSPQIPLRKPFYLLLPIQLSHRLVPTPLA